MAPQDRFESLEPAAPLPEELKTALGRLSRFDALEIGAAAPPPAPAASPAAAAAPAPPADASRSLRCVHCGQLNEAERQTCWACYRPLGADAPAKSADKGPADITLVLDGVTYTSGQKDLPDDVRELMNRIRKNGYSPELLSEWRSWRVTRHSYQPEPIAFEPVTSLENVAASDDAHGIKVFRGQRVSVIRLDGKVYTSDDPGLSPELKTLFAYLEAHGVTPALMEHLRQMGGVKVRPPTTGFPSDGDLAFWDSVNACGAGSPAGPVDQTGLALRLADEDAQRRLAEHARRAEEQARRRAVAVAIGVAAFLLYLIAVAVLR